MKLRDWGESFKQTGLVDKEDEEDAELKRLQSLFNFSDC